MRILSLTGGASGMYCGSCMRDNALATELIARGHDVILVPMYTPTLTDEPNVSQERVFFGGISVYLQQHSALFRHLPAAVDKLWDSQWALNAVSGRSIPVNPRFLGEMTVSMLRGEDGLLRKEVHKLTGWLRGEAPPDVIGLPFSLLIGLANPLKETLHRPVCVTLQGEDLFLNGLLEPWRSQSLDLIRSQIDSVDAFIAVSEYYADFMARYLGIPGHKIHTVPLGINMDGHERVERPADPEFRIGYMARIAPEKGLHVLADAYQLLRRRTDLGPARVDVAGYLPHEHKPYLADIEQRMRDAGLAAEFRYHGAPDRESKIRFLQSLDVLSVPSTYDEPKGIFLFEAMANGVPVVQPRRGAYPEILAKTRGGILVEPDSPESLADGLYALAKDREHCRRLGMQGYHGVREHYTLARMAARTLEVYADVARLAYSTAT